LWLIQIKEKLPADLPNADVPVALATGGAQSRGGNDYSS